MSLEVPTRRCSVCEGERVWILRRRPGRPNTYCDEHGKRWAGRRCPSCERSRVAAALCSTTTERQLLHAAFAGRGWSVCRHGKSEVGVKTCDGAQLQVPLLRVGLGDDGVICGNAEPGSSSDPWVAVVITSVKILTGAQAAALLRRSD